jgi:hypothetical protein
MLATRNFSSKYLLFWLCSLNRPSICESAFQRNWWLIFFIQAGASSTRRATVPTSRSQPIAARRSKRMTSKVTLHILITTVTQTYITFWVTCPNGSYFRNIWYSSLRSGFPFYLRQIISRCIGHTFEKITVEFVWPISVHVTCDASFIYLFFSHGC